MEFIGFKGKKKLWNKFVKKCKKEGRTIWSVLEIYIKKYVEGEKHES
jgi:reverse gyrase